MTGSLKPSYASEACKVNQSHEGWHGVAGSLREVNFLIGTCQAALKRVQPTVLPSRGQPVYPVFWRGQLPNLSLNNAGLPVVSTNCHVPHRAYDNQTRSCEWHKNRRGGYPTISGAFPARARRHAARRAESVRAECSSIGSKPSRCWKRRTSCGVKPISGTKTRTCLPAAICSAIKCR